MARVQISRPAGRRFVFNNNNQTDGVAQAPAGAQLLRRLLEEAEVPVG